MISFKKVMSLKKFKKITRNQTKLLKMKLILHNKIINQKKNLL